MEQRFQALPEFRGHISVSRQSLSVPRGASIVQSRLPYAQYLIPVYPTLGAQLSAQWSPIAIPPTGNLKQACSPTSLASYFEKCQSAGRALRQDDPAQRLVPAQMVRNRCKRDFCYSSLLPSHLSRLSALGQAERKPASSFKNHYEKIIQA